MTTTRTTAAQRRDAAADRRKRTTTTHALLIQAQEAVNAIPLNLGDLKPATVQAVHEAITAVRAAQSAVKAEVKG